MFAVISAEQISSLMLRHSSAGKGDWGEAGLGHKYQCVRLSAGLCVIFVVLFSRFRENSTPLNAAVFLLLLWTPSLIFWILVETRHRDDPHFKTDGRWFSIFSGQPVHKSDCQQNQSKHTLFNTGPAHGRGNWPLQCCAPLQLERIETMNDGSDLKGEAAEGLNRRQFGTSRARRSVHLATSPSRRWGESAASLCQRMDISESVIQRFLPFCFVFLCFCHSDTGRCKVEVIPAHTGGLHPAVVRLQDSCKRLISVGAVTKAEAMQTLYIHRYWDYET